MGLKSLVMEADTKQINTHMQNVKAEWNYDEIYKT